MEETEADQVSGNDEAIVIETEEHSRLARLHAAGLLSDEEYDSALARKHANLPHRQG